MDLLFVRSDEQNEYEGRLASLMTHFCVDGVVPEGVILDL